jgi:hypothetical protein
VSFPSEPGRDDGNLPPVNVVIPDDARELDRDVLAYRRELRARRRRERLLRLFRPVTDARFGSGAAIIPLIAACLALTLVGGALLSVMTIGPASAPVVTSPRTSSPRAGNALNEAPQDLPEGTLRIGAQPVAVRSLVSSVIAIIPADCGCGAQLGHLAELTEQAGVRLYFAGGGTVIKELPQLAATYGRGRARAAADADGVLQNAFHPVGLLVLLVFNNARAIPLRTLPPDPRLTPVLAELRSYAA